MNLSIRKYTIRLLFFVLTYGVVNLSTAQNLIDGKFEELINSPIDKNKDNVSSKNGQLALKYWEIPNQSQPFFEETTEGRRLKVTIGQQLWKGEQRSNYHEYVQANLYQALEKGVWYKLSFQMKTAKEANLGMTDMEVYFGTKPLPKKLPAHVLLPSRPQLKREKEIIPPNLFDYYKEWQTVEKYYQAKGGEQFLIWGSFSSHFNDYTNLSGQVLGEPSNPYQATYYFKNIYLEKVPPPQNKTKPETVSSPKNKKNMYEDTLDNIYFETASDNLSTDSKDVLNQLYTYLTTYADLNLEIIGHTDETGSVEENYRLSERRAKTVVDYLTKKGINRQRLIPIGKGKEEPVAINLKETDRRKNRRVSFKLLFAELSEDQLMTLEAFSRIYAYVRFFYPGDLAQQIDWNLFAAYGAAQIINQTADKDKSLLLRKLLLPIAPDIFIAQAQLPCSFPKKKPSKQAYLAWQHLGLDSDMNLEYHSRRVHRDATISTDEQLSADSQQKLFEQLPKQDEQIEVFLEELQLCVSIPLTASTKKSISSNAFLELKKKIKETDYDQRVQRIASSMTVWNVVQHFFPYLEKVDKGWGKEHRQLLAKVATCVQRADYEHKMKTLVARLKDGHARFVHESYGNKMFPSIEVEWINHQLVIIEPFQNKDLKRGDKILTVDGLSAQHLFRQDTALISGSPQWKIHKAAADFAVGKYESWINLVVQRDQKQIGTKVQRVWPIHNSMPEAVKELKPEVYYLQLTTLPPDSLLSMLPTLKTAKGIVVDARGYPPIGDAHLTFLEHFLDKKDTVNWAYTPQIIYPDQKKLRFKKEGWELTSKSKKVKPELVFLTNGSALSACESFLSMVKHYKVGTIIGTPTAGANGGANRVHLLDGYKFYWTGQYVTLLDGTYYHGIGIKPDIFCQPKIEDIQAGRDVLLEKALEVINQ